MKLFFGSTLASIILLISSTVLAGGHNAAIKEAMKDPKKMEAFMEDRLDHKTGLEGKEPELGKNFVALVQEMGGKLDMSKMSDDDLGRYLQIVVETTNHNASYQHQYNDALVKLHLTAVSFAKEIGMYEELVENDIQTTEYMMKRIGNAIKMTGRKDFALMAIFEQTTCFFQLVDTLQWNSPTSITYTSPFGRVMEASQKVGIFDNLTEEEVHNNYIVPRYMAYAEIMGVELDVSPLGANGEVTVSLRN
ncbi:MAG: hypothetical protein P8M26_00275 [Gammaproteobacteria bacterium]|jgi:hypothetical protein|nr:hypothetical protein [Gammaproteobacteria bacterium]